MPPSAPLAVGRIDGIEASLARHGERFMNRVFTPTEIAYAMRQAEAGTAVADECRQLGISEATYYVWKKRYGNLGLLEVRELRQLEFGFPGLSHGDAAAARVELRRIHVQGGHVADAHRVEVQAAGRGDQAGDVAGGGEVLAANGVEQAAVGGLDGVADGGGACSTSSTSARTPTVFARRGMTLKDIGRYRRAGVNIGTGTDTYPHNMLEELRNALYTSRLIARDPFDLRTGEKLRDLPPLEKRIEGLRYSPDGSYLIVSGLFHEDISGHDREAEVQIRAIMHRKTTHVRFCSRS